VTAGLNMAGKAQALHLAFEFLGPFRHCPLIEDRLGVALCKRYGRHQDEQTNQFSKHLDHQETSLHPILGVLIFHFTNVSVSG